MLITNRDIKIMKFINEFGFCEMPQIEKRFNLKKPRSYQIMQRLIKEGLVLHQYIFRHKHGVYHLTRAGASYTDLPMLKYVSLGSYLHQLTVVNVYLELIQRFPNATWISERRLKRDKFLEKGFFSPGHVADGMLIFPDDKKIAIEVELAMKAKDRLKGIIDNYAIDCSIDAVWYYCAPEIVDKVKRVVSWLPGVRVLGVGMDDK